LSGLKPTIPGLLLTGGLLLLEWWLNQPSPPSIDNYTPTETTQFTFGLDPLKSYRIDNDSTVIFGTPTSKYRGLSSRVISGAILVSNLKFYPYFPASIAAAHGYTVTYANNSTQVFPRYAVGGNVTYRESGGIHSFTVTELSSNKQTPPTPSFLPPAPPYALAPQSNNAPPLNPPLPQNPTPTNPVPLGNPPGTTPFFTPFPRQSGNKPDQKNDSPDEKETGPWFVPFPAPYGPFNDPFNFNPDPTSTTTGPYVVDDPLLNLALKKPPSPLTQPTPTPTTPTNPTNPTNPNNPSNPSNNSSTTTTPTTPPAPNKDKNPVPFFPPFPIINPKEPKVENPSNNPPPVNQTPPGNNCCVPTSVDQKLDNINNSMNPLLDKTIDLALLKVIDDKLGPQVNGGLSGFLTDKFTKLWNSRVIDRALNLMAVGASLHNAIMLSRDLGTTLIETTGNVLAAVGIKNADGEAFDFNTIIGQTVEGFVKSAVGEENYTKLKQTWVKANRILTAGANLIDSVRSMQNTMIEAQEIVGGWIAKIGNGLSQDGVVNDNTIDWMPEKPDFKNPFFRAQQTIENLTEAAESVNQLASSVIETQELTKQINDNYKAFTDEITVKSDQKKTKEEDKKQESESSDINKSDLKEGTPQNDS
jgi:hypothetical protein